MKKVIVTIVSLMLVLSLTSCGRKNDAKNLQIASHKKEAYVIKYCSTKLDFGNIYINIQDEKLVSFYTESDNDYKLSEYQLIIGDYSCNLNVTTDEGKKKTTTTFTLDNALKLIESVDEDGIETANENSIKIYVKFIDARTGEEDITDIKDDSYITISTTPTDLVEFIRNKEIKTE